MTVTSFSIGKYTLVDTKTSPLISRLASKYCHANDPKAVKIRNDADQFIRCSPEVSSQSLSIMFAIYDGDEFYGVFGMYDVDYIDSDLSGGKVTISAKCTPHLPNIGSDAWFWELTMFMKWFLNNEFVLDDLDLKLDHWEFSTDPQYAWTTDFCSVLISMLTHGDPVMCDVEGGLLRSVYV